MTFADVKICVALPHTALEEQTSLRDKTVKLGAIARSCAIFGVDLIQIFGDSRVGEASLMKKVLEYLETPQYLRKRLFHLDDSLRFAGLLPPLRIPSHKPRVPVEKLKTGELREGVTVSETEVDIGLDKYLKLIAKTPSGKRMTVRITKTSPLEGVPASTGESREYWGYKVEVRSLAEVLTDNRFEFRIATSRLGDPLEDSLSKLQNALAAKRSVKLLFGSPSRGLFEIVGQNLRGRVDLVVNLILEQNVVTVRTEEAISIALSLLGTLIALKRTKG